jgi:hypothetical protein
VVFANYPETRVNCGAQKPSEKYLGRFGTARSLSFTERKFNDFSSDLAARTAGFSLMSYFSDGLSGRIDHSRAVVV